MKTGLIVAFAGASLASSAFGGGTPTFFATNGSELYRYSSGTGVSNFTMSDDIVGMTTDAAGNIIASSPGTANMVGIYNLDNPFGTPTLNFQGSTAGNGYTSLTYVGSNLYGFFNGSQRIFQIDTTTYAGTDLGAVGVNDTTFGGSAYDAASDTFYALGRDVNDDSVALYTIGGFGGTLSATLVGDLGILGDGMALEFFDGTLYTAVQNIDNGHFELGSLDTGSGAFSFIQTLANSFSPDGDTTSLAIVVPAPASIAFLGLGGLVATRRRR